MTDIEEELIKYHYAQADILRLEHNLVNAKDRLKDAYIPPNMAVNPQLARVQKSEIESQVERIVILIEDNLKADVQDIETQLVVKRDVCRRILQWIQAGQLTGREEEYVRLRYLENNKVKNLPDMMHYEKTQIERIRAAALDKLQRPYEALYRKADKIHGEDATTA